MVRHAGRPRCDVYWGSHGCRKQRGHLGKHLCESGCWVPEDDFDGLYGDHVLSSNAGEDRRLREAGQPTKEQRLAAISHG